MSRFKFRFESIMRVRELVRDEARKKVAEAQQAYDVLKQRLTELGEDRRRLQAERVGRLAGQLSVAQLLDHGRYDLQIEADQRGINEQLAQIKEEIERRRQRLALAEQEYRKFEKLREIAEQEHSEGQLRRWQAEMDELAGRAIFGQGSATDEASDFS